MGCVRTCKTLLHVEYSLPMRPTTAWGVLWPDRHKADGSCSKCGGKRVKPGYYCRACRAAYMRAWRAKTNGKGE